MPPDPCNKRKQRNIYTFYTKWLSYPHNSIGGGGGYDINTAIHVRFGECVSMFCFMTFKLHNEKRILMSLGKQFQDESQL